MNYNPLTDLAVFAVLLAPIAYVVFKGENKTGATLARRGAIYRHQAKRRVRMGLGI